MRSGSGWDGGDEMKMIFDEMHTFRSMVIGKKMMDYVMKESGNVEEAHRAFLLGYLHDC